MGKITNFFKLNNEKLRKICLIWSPLVAAILIIVIGLIVVLPVWDEYVKKTTSTEDRTLFLLIVVSALLVALDTILFLYYDVFSTIKNYDPKKETKIEKKAIGKKFFIYVLLNSSTLLLAFVLIYRSFSTMYSETDHDFEALCKLNEILNVFIFLCFMIADYVFLKMIRDSLKSDINKNKLKKIEKSVAAAFYLIDVPGFVGVVIIFFLSINFLKRINAGFAHSFTVGALTFHLILTQFNLAYLRTKSLIKS